MQTILRKVLCSLTLFAFPAFTPSSPSLNLIRTIQRNWLRYMRSENTYHLKSLGVRELGLSFFIAPLWSSCQATETGCNVSELWTWGMVMNGYLPSGQPLDHWMKLAKDRTAGGRHRPRRVLFRIPRTSFSCTYHSLSAWSSSKEKVSCSSESYTFAPHTQCADGQMMKFIMYIEGIDEGLHL